MFERDGDGFNYYIDWLDFTEGERVGAGIDIDRKVLAIVHLTSWCAFPNRSSA